MHATQTARLATLDDVPELVRLREVMWTSMGLAVDGGEWRAACVTVLTDWLATGTGAAAVIDHPDGTRLIACGVGSTEQRLPGSSNPSGRYGYLANLVTEPAFRGRGLAPAVLAALLDWFTAQGVRIVDLHASRQGEPIYRAAGFRENAQPALRWRSA